METKILEKPRYILAWRHNGENHWDAVGHDGCLALLQHLVEIEHVNPASIFVIDGGGPHWMFPEYHKKNRTLWINNIYDEICGSSTPSDYSGPKAIPPVTPKESHDLYGFIAPDGRSFFCEYGGHSALARKIVGSLENIKDAHLYLEEKGWLVIFKDPISQGKYAVGMGCGRKLTDAQIRTIEKIGLPTSTPGVADHL